jgi:quercetin dioxygenase-like cupin family protein
MIPAILKHTFTYASATVNVYHANKGQGLPKHTHVYNHATMCNSGSCAIRVEGKELIINKDTQPINLQGSNWHEIEALEDGTVFVNVFKEGTY